MSVNKIKKYALDTIDVEIQALEQLKEGIDDSFVKVIDLLSKCKGRIVITGIGKSAIIAQKIVATLNSTGTPSLFMHAADAIHGDLGMVQKQDILIVISNSGESPEIKVLVPILKHSGNIVIALTGSRSAFLSKNADHVVLAQANKEACPNNLAPTASTTAQLAIGDAIAICLLKIKGFTPEDFAKVHPGGSIGKKIYLKVEDICKNNTAPIVLESDSVKVAIIEITEKRLGSTAVKNKKNKLCGIVTDGDIRRMIEQGLEIKDLKVSDIMNSTPLVIDKNELAVNALNVIRKNKVSQLIVTDKGKYFNILHFHDLIREGIV